MWVFFIKEFDSFSYKNSMEMWYDKNNDIENLRKEDFMRKRFMGLPQHWHSQWDAACF